MPGISKVKRFKIILFSFECFQHLQNLVQFRQIVLITAVIDKANSQMVDRVYKSLKRIGETGALKKKKYKSFVMIGYTGPGRRWFVKQVRKLYNVVIKELQCVGKILKGALRRKCKISIFIIN